jgi:hypothetical protein
MDDRFIDITKGIFLATISISFCEVILSKNYFKKRNNIKIIIFSGTLTFQMYLRKNGVCSFIISAHMDLTRKDTGCILC